MQKYISELEDVYEEVVEALKHRTAELESELERTENYSSYYQVFMSMLCYCVSCFMCINESVSQGKVDSCWPGHQKFYCAVSSLY